METVQKDETRIKIIESKILKKVSAEMQKQIHSAIKSSLKEIENIQKGIIVQNGVRHPKEGEPAYVAWRAFEELVSKGVEPNQTTAGKLAQKIHQPQNVVVLDLYLWRKFNGKVAA
jgi:hypothetical protein